jgi:hypothetical protein
MQAMLQMEKLDINEMRRAYDGAAREGKPQSTRAV